MLKERTVARFIVAPSGYGKTRLAVDYAETVFSWVHTFFVNCKSPCFIRDLDDDSIAQACLKHDSEARLVVFDAVPVLDMTRAKRFSQEIDALLAADCEVLVTCTPAGDCYGQLQADQVRIGSFDLLLTDEELEASRSAEERSRGPVAQLSAAHRVPALVWGVGVEAKVTFLKACFNEAMPSDLLLAMTSMLVLQRGSLESLASLGPIDLQLVQNLLDSYPHLGYDEEAGSFETPVIAIDDIGQALKKRFDPLVERSSFEKRHELVLAWAELLLKDSGLADRACDVVRVLCPRQMRGSWIASRVIVLTRAGCFYSALRLARSMSTRTSDISTPEKAKVHLLEAVCCAMLGDRHEAFACAKRFCFDENTERSYRIYGLLVAERYAPDATKQRAEAELGELAEDAIGLQSGRLQMQDALLLAWRAALSGSAGLADAWDRIRMAGACDEALCLVASRLFNLIDEECKAAGTKLVDPNCNTAPVERYLRGLIESEQGLPSNFFAISAGMSMERAHVNGMAYNAGPLSTKTLVGLRHAEMSLLRQRQLYRQQLEEEKSKESAWPTRTSSPSLANLQASLAVKMPRNVPILEVKMFGCFEVSIGGELLDPNFFQRQNVRSLFVLLAINQGREMTRDKLASAIWPKSSIEVARKNFYSVWGQLKRGLTLSDGTCPYLIRRQYGYSLDTHYVHSDITRLVQICRELMFGRPNLDEWSAIFAEIDRDFVGELMPAEVNNPLVASARNEYRTRLVDALVAATQRIVEAGNPQWGIWFSRMAISFQNTREDAYVALMRAQVAADQRTAAIMTFLTCQRVLAEELGVDPSPETMALYESLLD